MNKKKIIIIISIIIVVIIMGLVLLIISRKDDNKMDENNVNQILDTNQNNNESKILVVYFSKTGENYNVGTIDVGNTAMMASYIKEYLNADSFEIVPVNKYPDNYNESTELASKEKAESARPEIKEKLNNINDYDTIFLGYPIWWGDLPMIVYTFIEEYDLSNKTVIPFNTHEGSGNAGTYSKLKTLLPNSNVNINGLAIQGKVARTNEGMEKVIEWLKGLGF